MVISSSLFSFDAKNSFKDWKRDILPTLSDTSFRRAGRFAIAAVCGALDCIKDFPKKNEVKIYFGSANGDITSIIESQDSIFLHNLFPMPFSFINTLNNTPLFYLMQYLNIENSGISTASKNFAFEQSLSLALVDLKQNRTKYALVGVCDVWFLPREIANKFLNQNAHEFSAWILLGQDEKNFSKFFDTFENLIQELKKQKSKKNVHLSTAINSEEIIILEKYINKIKADSLSAITNESALMVANYFNKNKNEPYFYIGKDERFGYSFICINAK